MFEIKFCDIDGINLGHAQNIESGTGCTVVLCKEGGSCGVDVRGGSPGTRETDLLNPLEFVDKVHGVVLSGGSAFGLDASSGVMKYLEERNCGFDVGMTKVPIVCQAVLFDLGCGNYKIRPDKTMGYEACINSENYNEDINGNIGAGTGATVGKILGPSYSMKGGLGSYAVQIGDLKVGSIVGVNALGDIWDNESNKIIAGALNKNKNDFINTENFMINNYDNGKNVFTGNTTIGIIVTNGIFNKSQINKIASMAHNGFGRAIRPAHTLFDGDTIFALSTNKVKADINVVGMLSAKVMEKAIIRGIKSAKSAYNFPSYDEIKNK
ncbi:P1 family peptidase [Clostridium fallax]|uniref:L-aminopeptidase/D-esterase n=1 Tax=Clostridium fallax TaxID=1533 RepID=A0A1M4Y9R5_9CLOT|nr:P1 family peptidase [Clostridium fallax]SHF02383.1 L-aminopeptidase/D-esterase [Clostridium fallax]SQB06036.1 T4 family peptidase [Clostridium fallax]